MLSNFQNARPEMLKFSYASTTMILSIFYPFIQWLRRLSISLFFDRPEMLNNFEKGRPEMLVTGDAYHWGMTVVTPKMEDRLNSRSGLSERSSRIVPAERASGGGITAEIGVHWRVWDEHCAS